MYTRPQDSACSAEISSPSKAIPFALARPNKFGTNQDAPTSEMIPSCGPNTNLNFAVSETNIKSPHNAKPTPPPAAIPLIAFTTGLGQLTIFLTNGLKPISIALAVDSPGDHLGSDGQPPPARSAPLQKPRPSPVRTTVLISAS